MDLLAPAFGTGAFVTALDKNRSSSRGQKCQLSLVYTEIINQVFQKIMFNLRRWGGRELWVQILIQVLSSIMATSGSEFELDRVYVIL